MHSRYTYFSANFWLPGRIILWIECHVKLNDCTLCSFILCYTATLSKKLLLGNIPFPSQFISKFPSVFFFSSFWLTKTDDSMLLLSIPSRLLYGEFTELRSRDKEALNQDKIAPLGSQMVPVCKATSHAPIPHSVSLSADPEILHMDLAEDTVRRRRRWRRSSILIYTLPFTQTLSVGYNLLSFFSP